MEEENLGCQRKAGKETYYTNTVSDELEGKELDVCVLCSQVILIQPVQKPTFRNYFYRRKLSLTTSFGMAISDNSGICELLDGIFLF